MFSPNGLQIRDQHIFLHIVACVKIDFDASANVLAINLPADSTGDEYYDDFTAITNNAASSGFTGDLDFTTLGHGSGDTYMIVLKLIKNQPDL